MLVAQSTSPLPNFGPFNGSPIHLPSRRCHLLSQSVAAEAHRCLHCVSKESARHLSSFFYTRDPRPPTFLYSLRVSFSGSIAPPDEDPSPYTGKITLFQVLSCTKPKFGGHASSTFNFITGTTKDDLHSATIPF